MNFFDSIEDDEDENPSPILATAFDVLPAALLERAVTPDQMSLIAGEGTFCLAVEVPSAEWVKPVLRSIIAIGDWDHRFSKAAPSRSKSSTDDLEATAVVRYLAQGGRVLGVVANLDLLPPALRTSADLTLRLAPPSPALIQQVIEAVAGPCPADVPSDLGCGLGFDQIVSCLRAGSTAKDCIERLTRIGKERKNSDLMVSDVPELTELHGYGEAMAWALQLVEDLNAFRSGALAMSDLQSAVILASAPGLGKTTFIRSVARTTGLPLVVTSVSQWFSSSSGHLDGVIKQIDEVFARARSLAPAILFFDEIDALPDRSRLDSKNRDYWLPVVAHMLTLLDGAVSGHTKDLVVVAATNFPESLDPAICRPGRLSRIIRIGLPDETALAGILRQHLGQDLIGADLSEAARLAHGCSGADATAYVKTARATARTAKRPMELVDLLDAIAPPEQRDPEHLHRIALHEAGHAVTAHALKLGRVLSVSIISRGVAGGLCHVEGDGYAPTRAVLEDHVVQMLGGRAAEEAVLGEAGTGAGGHESSDLASATRELGLLRLSLGLGDELIYRGGREEVPRVLALDPKLSKAVEADLRRLYGRALGIVRDNLHLVHAIAEELLATRHIGADRFLAIVDATTQVGGQSNG
jgi:cell division protease FtsH